MKNLICCGLVCMAFSVIASAQGEKRFPGVSAAQFQQLRTAKKTTPLPLPTWIPAGFKLEKIEMKLGPRVRIENRVLAIVFSRKLPNGKTQRFALEAGFEGLGDLPYDTTSSVRSPIGPIDIAYEPPDLDGEGRKEKNFVMTHWFNVGKTAFHYDGMYKAEPDDKTIAMISLADTRKILQSLTRF
jgi:hypothetical protein